MTRLTIFSAPKPFTDAHINTIQRNAIQSWLHIADELAAEQGVESRDLVDVILVGDEVGIAEVAAEYGVKHLPAVKTNEQGTPLVSSIFELARQNSDSPLLCYVNADILLLPSALRQALAVEEQRKDFLLVGQRWDLNVTEALDFSGEWTAALYRRTLESGRLHVPAGSDYFIFPRHLFTELPDFAIGRAGWDNWMIYHAVTQPWPAIDATPSIMIVHQNHDYRHLKGAQPHYKQDETFVNADLGGGMQNMFMVLDANKELRDGRITNPRPRLARLVRRLERAVQPPGLVGETPRWRVTRALRKLRKRLVREVTA